MDKNWRDIINDDLTVILANYSDKQLNFTITNSKWIALSFLLLLLGIIPGIILMIFIAKAERIEREILQKLNLQKYYELAFAQESNNKFTVKNITRTFEVAIENFIPNSGRTRVDLVLNINTEFSNYSIGTLTQQVKHVYYDSKGNSHERTDYFRFPYLTIELNKSLEMNAVIFKSKSFLGIFKTRDNTQLESTEFEKIYAINTDNQIAIRKLLTPKIMVDLIDKANQTLTIPSLNIHNNHLTFAFSSYRVTGWNDPEGVVTQIDLRNKKDQILNDICAKIIFDYQRFINYNSWFETYQIYKT